MPLQIPPALVEFPDPPAGFNAKRDNVPHGKVNVVEYDSKTVGNKRKALVYTPPRTVRKGASPAAEPAQRDVVRARLRHPGGEEPRRGKDKKP